MNGTRILIAGCGYVGTPLAEGLARDGCEVWILRRSDTGQVPAGVRVIRADLTRLDGPDILPLPLDVVFFTAAANSRNDDDYRKLFVDGMRGLTECLREQAGPLRRIIMTSSTGVYGQHNGEWVDETSPTEPPNPSNRFILEGERTLLGSGLPGCVVRLAGIYGPGRTRLIRTVREGTARIPPGPPQYLNQIHRDDCVGVLRHVMQMEEPAPVYIAADHEPTTRNDVLEWIARRLEAPLPGMAGNAAPGDRKPRGNKRCSNRLLLKDGYTFAYPTYREGYEALIRTL